jgi:hypothetical protein
MATWPLEPKTSTLFHFAPFDEASNIVMTNISSPIVLNLSNLVLIVHFASTSQN